MATAATTTAPTFPITSSPLPYFECASSFSSAQTLTIRVLTLTSAGLSILGSSLIIVSFLAFPRLRTFPFRLIVYLSTADLFASLAYYVGLGVGVKQGQVCSTAFACYLEANLSQYFDVATFMWTGVIAFNVHRVLVKDAGRGVEALETRYHALCWGLPLLLLVVAAGTGSFGDAGLWCWIKPSFPLTQLLCYYLWLIVVFVFNSVIFVLVVLHMRHDAKAAATQNAVTRRLLTYLLVFFFVRCWSVFDRLNDAASPGNPSYALAVLHSIFSPLQGFCNALVYGLTRSVVEEWKALFRRCCPVLLVGGGGDGSHELLDSPTFMDDSRVAESFAGGGGGGAGNGFVGGGGGGGTGGVASAAASTSRVVPLDSSAATSGVHGLGDERETFTELPPVGKW
jgi:hypothetical protein